MYQIVRRGEPVILAEGENRFDTVEEAGEKIRTIVDQMKSVVNRRFPALGISSAHLVERANAALEDGWEIRGVVSTIDPAVEPAITESTESIEPASPAEPTETAEPVAEPTEL